MRDDPKMHESASAEYGASSIQVLEGLEAVRKRPGMYIGSTGPRGLHHLVWEVVDNSVDEALAGYCDEIEVTVHEDGSLSVLDNGRGIPVDLMPQYKLPALEVVMSRLHAGGKFSKTSYKVSGGLHGVGISVVNALAADLKVTVVRDGTAYTMRFSRGRKTQDLTKHLRAPFARGTLITFVPDAQIFDETSFDYDVLATRLRELAFLNSGLSITILDERTSRTETFRYEGGIGEFVKYVSEGKQPIHEPITIKTEESGTDVEVAIEYNAGFNETVFSFVNNINTIEGGSHLTGFRSALTRAINQYAARYMAKEAKQAALSGSDVREGLAAIISVKVAEPQFEGQTKTKLGNSEVKGIVDSAVFSKLIEYFEEHPSEARSIVEKCLSSARARQAAQKARELVRRKSVLESSTLPGKLADCSTRERDKAELYIVEGDSAGGSAKQARSRDFQAILPLRGKILNVEKAHLSRAIRNREIQALITAIGTSIGDEFDLTKLRYGKIVIMTDADVDGAHIRTLLLTFFFRYMPELIENGKVYIAQPPLYRAGKGKQAEWFYTDAELDPFMADHTGWTIQRYKGLGEMNPQQLWETTMDPEQRKMLHVSVDDAIYADKLFTILMGTEVEPRRDFIERHALEVENLDL